MHQPQNHTTIHCNTQNPTAPVLQLGLTITLMGKLFECPHTCTHIHTYPVLFWIIGRRSFHGCCLCLWLTVRVCIVCLIFGVVLSLVAPSFVTLLKLQDHLRGYVIGFETRVSCVWGYIQIVYCSHTEYTLITTHLLPVSVWRVCPPLVALQEGYTQQWLMVQTYSVLPRFKNCRTEKPVAIQ